VAAAMEVLQPSPAPLKRYRRAEEDEKDALLHMDFDAGDDGYGSWLSHKLSAKDCASPCPGLRPRKPSTFTALCRYEEFVPLKKRRELEAEQRRQRLSRVVRTSSPYHFWKEFVPPLHPVHAGSKQMMQGVKRVLSRFCRGAERRAGAPA
jgi:hypothetical protein